jgi:hypothetical protein
MHGSITQEAFEEVKASTLDNKRMPSLTLYSIQRTHYISNPLQIHTASTQTARKRGEHEQKGKK